MIIAFQNYNLLHIFHKLAFPRALWQRQIIRRICRQMMLPNGYLDKAKMFRCNDKVYWNFTSGLNLHFSFILKLYCRWTAIRDDKNDENYHFACKRVAEVSIIQRMVFILLEIARCTHCIFKRMPYLFCFKLSIFDNRY